MSPLNLELGLSSSASAGARSGTGDFAVGGSGAKQSQTLLIVVGAVLIFGILAWVWSKAS